MDGDSLGICDPLLENETICLPRGPSATPVVNFEAVFSDNLFDLNGTKRVDHVGNLLISNSGYGPECFPVGPNSVTVDKVKRNLIPNDEVCSDVDYFKLKKRGEKTFASAAARKRKPCGK